MATGSGSRFQSVCARFQSVWPGSRFQSVWPGSGSRFQSVCARFQSVAGSRFQSVCARAGSYDAAMSDDSLMKEVQGTYRCVAGLQDASILERGKMCKQKA